MDKVSYNIPMHKKCNNIDKFSQKDMRDCRYVTNISNYDTVSQNSLSILYNSEKMSIIINSNKDIQRILKSNNLKAYINTSMIDEIIRYHGENTKKTATAIIKHLPMSIRMNINPTVIKEGAVFHDIGKILIPESIIQKPASLDDKEHKIMSLHPELGYHLAKSIGLKEETAQLVKNHHNYTSNSNSLPDTNTQIVEIADKYNALIEKRAYKPAYTKEKALSILAEEVKEGKIEQILYDALVKAVS